MSGTRTQRQQAHDLRLKFFSLPVTTTSRPVNTTLLRSKTTTPSDTTRREAQYQIMPDCACK